MSDNTKKFSGKADVYVKGRPSYSKEAVKYLNSLGVKKGAKVADIGSGTGIFSKQLLDLEVEVFAVEPNDEMREKAEELLSNYKNFHSINASAENTTIEDKSIDFITAAQAFHWFNLDKFKKECKRILKSNGKVILLWNNGLNKNDLSEDLYKIFNKYNPREENKKSPINTEKRIKKFFSKYFGIYKNYEEIKFVNEIIYTKESFIANNLSISCTPNPNNENSKIFSKEIGELFDKYQVGGKIISHCDTVLYIGKL